MVFIKTLFSIVRRRSGISLIEVIMTLVLTSIIMLGLIAFLNFTGTTTGIVMGRSQIQGEMRQIMQNINIELTAATGALIVDGVIPPGVAPEVGHVLFGRQEVAGEDRFVIRSDFPLSADRVYNLSFDYFTLTFEAIEYNLIRVSMEYDDGNNTLWFEMTEDILLPNLGDTNPIAYPASSNSGGTLVIDTVIRDVPGPPDPPS